MTKKTDRDVEKSYPLADFIAKLRRLADALETGERFAIQVERERIFVPKGAHLTIEHERGDGEEEVEFQIKWRRAPGRGDEEESAAASERVV